MRQWTKSESAARAPISHECTAIRVIADLNRPIEHGLPHFTDIRVAWDYGFGLCVGLRNAKNLALGLLQMSMLPGHVLRRVYDSSKHTISVANPHEIDVAVLRSSAQRRVTGLVSPSLSGMARAGPSRSIGPLPGGSKFSKLIAGFTSLAPCIGKRASKSVTGRISRYRCRRCAVSCSKRTALAPR